MQTHESEMFYIKCLEMIKSDSRRFYTHFLQQVTSVLHNTPFSLHICDTMVMYRMFESFQSNLPQVLFEKMISNLYNGPSMLFVLFYVAKNALLPASVQLISINFYFQSLYAIQPKHLNQFINRAHWNQLGIFDGTFWVGSIGGFFISGFSFLSICVKPSIFCVR